MAGVAGVPNIKITIVNKGFFHGTPPMPKLDKIATKNGIMLYFSSTTIQYIYVNSFLQKIMGVPKLSTFPQMFSMIYLKYAKDILDF